MDKKLFDPQLRNSLALEIRTLGQFSVRRGNKVLSEEAKNSKKLWDLFKYFITHRHENLLPEIIQEALWSESDFEYSQRAFRTLVYRLRKLIKKGVTTEEDINPIIFAHGCYHWNTKIKYWFDFEELENNFSEAKNFHKSNPEKAIYHYHAIFDLYKGSYLQESLYMEWSIPTRDYYRHLYIQAMTNYLEILKTYGKYPEIIEICEKIILLEPHEEEFYIYLIGSLLRLKKIYEARIRYEHITTVLYKEFGVKPSAEMSKLYTQIKSERDSPDFQRNFQITSINNKPLFCDTNTFISIYELEQRRAERTGNHVLIVSLFLKHIDEKSDTQKTKIALNHLKKVLDNNLRRGDVYTVWNESKIRLILSGLNIEFAADVMDRIEKAFWKKHINEKVSIQIQYETVYSSGTALSCFPY